MSTSPRLSIVVASTRPGRVGPLIADWVRRAAEADGRFDVHLEDLADYRLPVFDEPRHPRLKAYEHEHTRRWSATVEASDAFVLVTPEYNFSTPPALVNALDFLHGEWACKPAAFVSYGGISGGLRGVQMTKQILTSLKVMPLPEAVVIPMVGERIRDGAFHAAESHETGAKAMLAELHRWALALRPLREAA
jgi:NAD(P)H-dependent FMN reductase